MKLHNQLEEFGRYMWRNYKPYIQVIIFSSILGAVFAYIDATFTRALANWITMTFAGIGLYIAINNYGFKREEKSERSLVCSPLGTQTVYVKDDNNTQSNFRAHVYELTNNCHVSVTVINLKNCDVDVYTKYNPQKTNYRKMWDGREGKFAGSYKDNQSFVLKQGEMLLISANLEEDSEIELEYFIGIDRDNVKKIILR